MLDAVADMSPGRGSAALVMDPQLSLGWRDGPLDGLSCLLRCLESLLRGQGQSSFQTAHSLVVPLDLKGGRRVSGRYRFGQVDWRSRDDGRGHWEELRGLVEAGSAVILMPDRYYWPGDEFWHRRHFLDHMVLITSVDDHRLQFLDTDGPPEHGYRRELEVTDEVRRSGCRFATARFDDPVVDTGTTKKTLLEPTARWLAADLPGLVELDQWWAVHGLTGPLARALHVVVLGEIQPHLFLSGIISQPTWASLSHAASAASRSAQAFGKILLAAHRYGGADESTTAPYDPIRPAFTQMVADLRGYSTELCSAVLPASEADAWEEAPATGAFLDRLDRMRAWCYAPAVATPTAAR